MTYINHPYLKVLQDTLKIHKTLLECLEKRMTLIHIDYATKNEYEKNLLLAIYPKPDQN